MIGFDENSGGRSTDRPPAPREPGESSAVSDLEFEPTGKPLAEFRRDAGSKAVGCLVYLVITPFIAIYLAVLPSLVLRLAFRELGLSEQLVDFSFPFLLVLTSLVTALWAIREYRGRASTEIAVYRDGLVATIGGVRRVVDFAEVSAVRLDPAGMDLACTLVTKSGRKLRLPPDVAPCSVARGALEATVIRTLARRVGERIDAGESAEVVEDGKRSTFIIGRGLMMVAVGVLLVLSLRHARRGVGLARFGVLIVSLGRIGLRGGIALRSDGVRRLGAASPEWIGWEALEFVQADPFLGIGFRLKDGRSVVASPFADGCWPAAAWLARRAGRTSPRKS